VGIQPEVAFAMVRFGINLDSMYTALDLEEGLSLLDQLGSSGAELRSTEHGGR
jgi:rsbT antagonist protein RsbS